MCIIYNIIFDDYSSFWETSASLDEMIHCGWTACVKLAVETNRYPGCSHTLRKTATSHFSPSLISKTEMRLWIHEFSQQSGSLCKPYYIFQVVEFDHSSIVTVFIWHITQPNTCARMNCFGVCMPSNLIKYPASMDWVKSARIVQLHKQLWTPIGHGLPFGRSTHTAKKPELCFRSKRFLWSDGKCGKFINVSLFNDWYTFQVFWTQRKTNNPAQIISWLQVSRNSTCEQLKKKRTLWTFGWFE